MARICVKATPSDDLQRYELRLDNDDAEFIGADNTGCKNVPGMCGDGSARILYYTLFGPIGAKLTVKITCGGAEIGTYEIEIFPPGGEMGGQVDFVL